MTLEVVYKFFAIALVISVAALFFISRRGKFDKIDILPLITTIFAGGSLPFGVLLLWLAVDPSEIKVLGKFWLYLAAIGIAVIAVSVMTIRQNIKRPDAKNDDESP